ncbi:MAG: serine/threonine protein kinase, partial [Actinomycetota bacterium]|nr:serine/threonine protein kinase [Actinomycetota bacterium]
MVFAGLEVLGQVGQGSTGAVWRARQVELDRVVAIKELSPALLGAPGFLDRFRAEAQTLASLDDPHVVRIFDYVEEPGRAYLVQEWVDGVPLDAVLARHGRLTPEQGLGVLRGGLLGLAHAHSRGLVHRDVSPANILLDRAGTSRLVDFGLAARTEEGRSPGAAASVGTPAFASPEAVTGAPMTTRSDVYSAAALLFLLLSGRLPYSGNTAAVLAAHASAPVPTLDGHGPELADLLARAMAKNPAERPADAAAFLVDLEEAATRRYGPAWHTRA